MPQILKEYVETGKVKYVVKDFPLEAIHKQAFKAAEATRCAGEQGKFWQMHEQLFANQRALDVKDMAGHAQAIGLDGGKFEQCLESGKQAAGIRKDLGDAQTAQVRATPTFFFGVTDGSGKLKATRMLRGAESFNGFKVAIDDLLGGQK